MDNPKKPNNLKTGLLLAVVALLFALGSVANRIWAG